jgi:type VI secretion system secreted protein VgrG
MALNVSLTFSDAPVSPIAGLVVHRYALRDAISELFECRMIVASTDSALDMATVVGQPVVIDFSDEPFLPQVSGLVNRVRQLTTGFPTPSAAAASHYEIDVVPRLWLTTRRREHRIFQKKNTREIIDEVLGGYHGRIPKVAASLADQNLPMREYRVQYGETDHDFIFRILAEDHISSFFDHASGSVFTLCDDTSVMTRKQVSSVPFAPTSGLNAGTSHVSNILVASRLETSAVTLRDYDYENPPLKPLQGKAQASAAGLLVNESKLEEYRYEVGAFRSPVEGDATATRDLAARRSLAQVFSCETNFALQVGSRFATSNHPRSEPNAGLLVVHTHVLADDGSVQPGTIAIPGVTHVLECIDEKVAFVPARSPRPRIHGTQTAFVIGDAPEGTVEVDAMGRVKLAFRWDRRDPTSGAPTRMVRVSQAWAGSGFGLVTLPRVGDEVVVSYADGDPDEPLVVGRVHNATVVTPLNLPEKDKALAVWRSRSFSASGPGSGFNQVLMDDTQGAERLELHAERDFKSETGRNAGTSVGVNESKEVGGSSSTKIAGAYSLTAGSTAISTGAYTLDADTIDETGKTHINTTTNLRTDESQFHSIHATGLYLKADGAMSLTVGGSEIDLDGDSIKLSNGGSSIKITAGEIVIVSPMIKLNP